MDQIFLGIYHILFAKKKVSLLFFCFLLCFVCFFCILSIYVTSFSLTLLPSRNFLLLRADAQNQT
jgi:hypothetical protein